MTVVPFPPRVPAPARTLDELLALKRAPHPSCDVTLRKANRTRRYVLWSDSPGRWLGEVWFDRCQHRQKHTAGLGDTRTLLFQFIREIRDLLADGWTTDGA